MATKSSASSAKPRSSSSAKRRPAKKAPARKPAQSRSTASQNGAGNGGVVGTLKKVGGPAVAIGATAVGVAGGIVLRGATRQKKILGVAVPRKLDVKSMAKTVGKASKQLGETSKSLSKDIERVGEQAERLGKILG